LESGFNSRIFNDAPLTLSADPESGFLDIRGKRGEFLFSVQFDPDLMPNEPGNRIAVLVFFFSLLALLTVLTFGIVRLNWRKGNHWKAILYAGAVLVAVRALMITFSFPKSFFEFDLFDPSGYASSWFNSSLGDLFLNMVCASIVFGMVFSLFSKDEFKKWVRSSAIDQSNGIFLMLAYISSTLFLVAFYGLYIDILSNSQWDLNILNLPTLDKYMIISLAIVYLGGAGYFLFSVLVMGLFFFKNPYKKVHAIYLLLGLALPTLAFLVYWDWVLAIAFAVHFLLLGLVVNFSLYRHIFKIGLNAFLIFFFGCLMTAIITGVASHEVYLERNYKSKVSFGTEQLVENDVLAEFFLADIIQRIANDLFLKNTLSDPLMQKDAIDKKIRKIHMINYFDQYLLKIRAFNAAGENVLDRGSPDTLEALRRRYVNSDNATSVRGLFFTKRGTERDGSQYFAFIPMFRQDVYVGTIFLELDQLRVLPGSVFPKLLIDEKFMGGINEKKFDFAVYEDDSLQYGVGLFNYRASGLGSLLNQPALYEKGIYRGGYHHIGVRQDQKVVIVSSAVYPIYYILADISLYFLGFVTFTLIGMISGTLLVMRGKVDFTYATKLQVYLNFAFFVPIFVISLIIVGLFTNSYQEELHRQYIQKASLVRDNLTPVIERRKAGLLERDELQEVMKSLSGTADTDINLYNRFGYLISTSQPNIFEKKVLTQFINPRAIVDLVEGQNNLTLLEEQIGDLSFKSVYSAIRSKDGQEVQAIVAVPFFESETELDFLIADVLSNIINIFVLVFVLFLVISYFVSRNLTFPFKLLTQKLKATGLDNNEPMYWPANDEIGLLVNEYNNMLYKLEESKKDLAESEKESAWREMAKQVAHEIKNPLTPMKLTLQHMLRLQAEGNLDDPKKLKKPVETLIHQVDTLSDIATSFSNFAKMPTPKKELMDFKELVTGTLELFKNRENEKVMFGDLTDREKLPVVGDKQLFGRIVANLIINGFQASDPNRKPVIHVFLREVDNQVLLEIRDNGKGIPKDLRKKIFMPNFSTKSEGSGLGLAIAKRGVETEGGKIWFETEEGKGTSFFLSFDLALDTEPH
jgi:signal transduction histidine kinase